MNILFLNHNFENFGTYFRCFYLGKNLARMGNKVTLVCASKKNIDFFIRKKHIEKNFTVITLPRVKFHQYHTGHLLRAIINCFIVLYSRYDILHSFAIAQPTTAIPTVFAKIFKPYKKIVVDWDDAWAGGFGSYHPAIVNYVLDYFERNILKLADMVTVVSSFLEREAYKIGIDARKVVKIPNGANPEKIKPIDRHLARKKIGVDKNAKILLSMGHTYMGNTMKFLMEAFKLVLASDTSIKLMFLGEMGNAEKEMLNNYKEIGNGLILAGEVQQSDVQFYLGSADILLLSMEDNIIERARFPIRFGDYIASSRPIVSNAVGEIKNVIVEGNCGIATSHGSVKEFATAIKTILDDTDLQKKFSRNSRVYAEEKLNFGKISKKLSINYKQKLFNEFRPMPQIRVRELVNYSKKYIHYYTGEIPPLIEDIFTKYSIKSVADLGAGDGSVLYALFSKGYLGNGKKVIAVDVSSERINNVKNINNNILGIVSDVCNLDMISNTSLDLAISSQVIEHVANEEAFIKETSRILSKGGLFYLSTVFKKWYGWYFYRCNGHWRLDPTHLREYTSKEQLLDLLKKHNFYVLKDKRSLQRFAISDFIFKRLGSGRRVYNSRVAKYIRRIRIPILGYYNWELVLKKK